MGEKFYITTAIYYANGPLHIGHCYEIVASDTIARYRRACGQDVRFLTGTDEHGSKIERKAKSLGKTPQEWVDEVSSGAKELFRVLRVTNDDFLCTSEERHKKVATIVFERLLSNGDIYLDQYSGWYCQFEESFWPESRVSADHLCPECGRPLEWAKEATYKFRLTKYARQVEALLRKPGFVLPESRRNEMLAFIGQGLEDISVSRTTLSWGIPVSSNPEHKIWVWVDALSNYISALGYASGDDGLYRKYWPANLHVVGKDILRFHAVIWPAILLSLGEPLPKAILTHGLLNINGQKISKSLGNSVDPSALISKYGVDAIRYYLLNEVPYGLDGSYSEEGIVQRTNVDLANGLGNLLSRTTQLINKFCASQVPKAECSDGSLQAASDAAIRRAASYLEAYRLNDALSAIWTLIDRANKYIEEQAPWALARDASKNEQLNSVLYDLAESIRVAAAALTPFLVETPEKIYAQLGLAATPLRSERWDALTQWGGIQPGTSINRGEPLFPRLG